MSALKCLACQHENKVEDKFCEACGSSLDLRFCPACEAVNGRGATRCHSCSAALPADAAEETAAPEEAAAPGETAAPQAQAQFRPPLRWRVIEADRSPARQAAVLTGRALLALSLVALGALAYHFYGEWSPAAKAAAAAAAPAAGASVAPRAEPPAPAPAPVAAVPPEPLKPKVAPAAASAPKRAAPEPKRAAQEPKQARRASAVTHLRGTAPAPAIAAPEPQEKTVAPAPPPAAEASHARVTHTRPGTAVPVVETTPPASPKSAASACPEAVAALGLCSANVKREGN